MRILLIGPVPPDVGGRTGGGVATHLWDLAVYLTKQGHTLGVLADNLQTEDLVGEVKDGIRLYGLARTKLAARSGYLLCPSLWWKVIQTKAHFRSYLGWKGVISGLLNYHQVIKHFQPDLIHIHHLEKRFPLAHFLVGDQIPLLTTVHSTSFIDFSPPDAAEERLAFIQRNFNLAQNLIFVSHFLEERFKFHFPDGWEGKNTFIVHNLVNGSIYYPISKKTAREKLGLDLEKNMILFVGKIIPAKGLKILIEAANLKVAEGGDLQVLIIGSGPQKDELENRVQELGLDDQIRFAGSKSQAELFLYYNAADVFALPSAMESFGLVFVEAMLCGCPVLGRPEVLLEILPSERCGDHIHSSNSEIWAKAIGMALRNAWSKQEIHDLSQVYTWDVSGENYVRIYCQILC